MIQATDKQPELLVNSRVSRVAHIKRIAAAAAAVSNTQVVNAIADNRFRTHKQLFHSIVCLCDMKNLMPKFSYI